MNEAGAVAVTGLRSHLGGRLAARLAQRRPGLRLVGFDRRRPQGVTERIRFHAVDATSPDAEAQFAERLAEEGVEAVVHCAFRTDATSDRDADHALDVDGSRRLLAACRRSGVRRLVVASSTMLYGARPDNPNFLTEDHPLRGHPGAHLVANRIEVEAMLAEARRDETAPDITLLRCCWVLGRSVENRLTRTLSRPVVARPIGFDPLIQFLHEDDQLAAFERAALESHPGVFNIVGQGVLPFSHALRLGDQRGLALPSGLLHRAGQYPSERRTGDPPSAFYDYLKYLWVADGARGWAEFGEPFYTSRETWVDFRTAVRAKRSAQRWEFR